MAPILSISNRMSKLTTVDQSILSSQILPSSTTAGGSADSSGGASTTGSSAVEAIRSMG